MKAEITGVLLRTLLVYVVLFSMLGSLASIKKGEAKFNIGDTFEVTTNLLYTRCYTEKEILLS